MRCLLLLLISVLQINIVSGNTVSAGVITLGRPYYVRRRGFVIHAFFINHRFGIGQLDQDMEIHYGKFFN